MTERRVTKPEVGDADGGDRQTEQRLPHVPALGRWRAVDAHQIRQRQEDQQDDGLLVRQQRQGAGAGGRHRERDGSVALCRASLPEQRKQGEPGGQNDRAPSRCRDRLAVNRVNGEQHAREPCGRDRQPEGAREQHHERSHPRVTEDVHEMVAERAVAVQRVIGGEGPAREGPVDVGVAARWPEENRSPVERVVLGIAGDRRDVLHGEAVGEAVGEDGEGERRDRRRSEPRGSPVRHRADRTDALHEGQSASYSERRATAGSSRAARRAGT